MKGNKITAVKSESNLRKAEPRIPVKNGGALCSSRETRSKFSKQVSKETSARTSKSSNYLP